MNRFIFSIAAAALVIIPSIAASQCGGDTCNVGAAGTGGERSEGKAQGFRTERPSTRFGGTIINTGNDNAGRLNFTAAGSISGTFREQPDATFRGHGTGLFGDWSGQCEAELAFDGC